MYKPASYAGQDITYHFFRPRDDVRIDFSGTLQIMDERIEDQFSPYSGLHFSVVQPFLEKYYSPSQPILNLSSTSKPPSSTNMGLMYRTHVRFIIEGPTSIKRPRWGPLISMPPRCGTSFALIPTFKSFSNRTPIRFSSTCLTMPMRTNFKTTSVCLKKMLRPHRTKASISYDEGIRRTRTFNTCSLVC